MISEPRFKYKSKVSFITEPTTKGIVLDIRYYYVSNRFEYFVSFCKDLQKLWLYDEELTEWQEK